MISIGEITFILFYFGLTFSYFSSHLARFTVLWYYLMCCNIASTARNTFSLHSVDRNVMELMLILKVLYEGIGYSAQYILAHWAREALSAHQPQAFFDFATPRPYYIEAKLYSTMRFRFDSLASYAVCRLWRRYEVLRWQATRSLAGLYSEIILRLISEPPRLTNYSLRSHRHTSHLHHYFIYFEIL